MRLKRLELQGFKSFADSVSLEFGEGITAIVGPNGSGKSNIADAVRWVLGEQSARTLRGHKMEDVIFAGSRGRRPLGMAQVRLVLDNSRGHLPLAYSEVSIARRLYRSGESEFFINKQNCRLKDIHDLFMDTGLGREGFAIIGQGQVDTVLSVRSEDRRTLLEETAGIMKYRKRKEESLRKLDDTNIDLLRVTDLLQELQEQLGPLQAEAAKARQYLALTGELKQVELDCYHLQWQKLQRQAEEGQESLKKVRQDYQEALRHHSQAEKEGQQLQAALRDLENRVNEKREALLVLREKQSEGIHKEQLNHERRQNNKDRESRLQELLARTTQELGKLESKSLELQGLAAEKQEEIKAQKQAWQKKERLLQEKQAGLQAAKEDVDRLKEEFFEFMRHLADQRNFARDFQDQKKSLTAQIQGAALMEKELAAACKSLKGRLLEIQTNKKDSQTKAGVQAQLEEGLFQKIVEQKKLLASLTARKNEMLSQFAAKNARLKTLQELESAYEGYGLGVRKIVSNRQLAPLVLGTVAEVMTVPQGLETAMEVALGAAMQNVITKTPEDAQTLIEWLKTAQAGRVTFLPLSNMSGQGFPPNLRAHLKMPGVLGTGLDLIQFAEKFRPVFASLLGRVVVCQDLHAALALQKRLRRFTRIVTPDGSVVFPSGAMAGGTFKNKAAGLLSRKGEILELQTGLQNLRPQIAQQEAEIRRIASHISQEEQNLEQLQAEGQLRQLQAERLTQMEAQTEAEIKRSLQELAELQMKKEEGQRVLDALATDEKEAAAQVEQLELEEGDFRQMIERRQSALGELEAEMQQSSAGLASSRVQLAELRGALENLQTQSKNVKERLQDSKDTHKEALLEKEQLALENHALQAALAEMALANAALQKEEASFKGQLLALQEKLALTRSGLGEHSQHLEVARKGLNRQERAVYRWEMKLEQLDKEQKSLAAALADREIPLGEISKRRVSEKQETLQKARQGLKQSINELGLVNPRAAQEYQRIQERCSFLETQLKDLRQAREDLEDVISEMDKLSRHKLQTAFQEVRGAFQKIFATLFQGGHADLVLTEPQAILTSGIDVLAQPPGKKLQNLLLLSGGERALTAIALLFAIRKVNPTPFCVLDEIDATLDDHNLGRFTQLMEEFSGGIQFLVITHRQATMEAAHTLYGVTMNQDAISQIISVAMA